MKRTAKEPKKRITLDESRREGFNVSDRFRHSRNNMDEFPENRKHFMYKYDQRAFLLGNRTIQLRDLDENYGKPKRRVREQIHGDWTEYRPRWVDRGYPTKREEYFYSKTEHRQPTLSKRRIGLEAYNQHWDEYSRTKKGGIKQQVNTIFVTSLPPLTTKKNAGAYTETSKFRSRMNRIHLKEARRNNPRVWGVMWENLVNHAVLRPFDKTRQKGMDFASNYAVLLAQRRKGIF